MTAGFRRLARLRDARAFHPVGRVGHGRLLIDGGDSALGGALGRGEHSVTVRLSRGIGLPDRSPDLLGLAVRVAPAHAANATTDATDAGADAQPIDLLLTTTAQPTWARWLVLPARRWTSRAFSTVLPYATADGGSTLIVLRPVTDWTADASPAALSAVSESRPLAFDVLESHPRWHEVGRLVVDEVGADESIAFDPMLHAAPGLRPVRPLSALREAAYRGSRQGRRD
ncbi:hypothetical protein [Nocardioides sp. Iso805N]|uniref:hypothetical protein n=1 Tax=Nocardioides sp. Iso805N TaxID=1283287 RepID=UPI0012F8D26C|nr:hypothetical protein [Nocardioides sp. Iso805N]